MSKISIVVPVYNMEKYLNRCIDSLRNQTLEDIEIILVDDGSTDSSLKICEEYAGIDKRIKVIHKSNGGLISAWKHGVKNANASYIGFVDPDDYCDYNYFYEMYLPILEGNDLDMVASGYRAIDTSGNIIKYPASDLLHTRIYHNSELEQYKESFFCGKYVVLPSRWTKIIKRDILLKNMDIINESITLCEDLCTTFACFLDCKNVAIINSNGYNYMIYDVSMSHRFNPVLIDNYDFVANTLKNIIQCKDYSINIDNELLSQCITIVFMIIRSDFSMRAKEELLKKLRNNDTVRRIIKNKSFVKRNKGAQYIKKLFELKLYWLIICVGKIYSIND